MHGDAGRLDMDGCALHYSNTEDGEQANLIAWSRLQPVDHGQRKKQHQDVDDDIDHRDSSITSDLVAAGPLHRRVPVFLGWSTDQDSDQYGHNEPPGLEAYKNPGHDLRACR